jgi:hypothetical protein
MKMTKIESARIIVKQEGDCYGVCCTRCFKFGFCNDKGLTVKQARRRRLADAEAYIKRHEGKSRKKTMNPYTPDVQPDTTGSKLVKVKMNINKSKELVNKNYAQIHLHNEQKCKRTVKENLTTETRPNFRKALRDKVSMKVRVTPALSEELQKIAVDECCLTTCNINYPFIFFRSAESKIITWDDNEKYFNNHEAKEYHPDTDSIDHIRDTTEKVEPKSIFDDSVRPSVFYDSLPPEFPELEPIKANLPDVFFAVTDESVEVIEKEKLEGYHCFKLDNEGNIIYTEVGDDYKCYGFVDMLKIITNKWGLK